MRGITEQLQCRIDRWRASAYEAMPRGVALPQADWDRRHRGLLVVTLLHFPFLVVIAAFAPEVSVWDILPYLLALPALAAFGAWLPGDRNTGWHRRARALLVVFALLTASMLLVASVGGNDEAHYHLFIILSLLALYEDWAAFALAAVYVFVHHVLLGVVFADSVAFYGSDRHDGPEAWRWAGVHVFFISLAAVANLILWRQHERARLNTEREAERRQQATTVAQTLAESLLPARLPELDAAELAARYLPGEGGVGGDWYDIIELEGGRIGVALGDVAGHGVKAAALTARLRHTLVAYAQDGLPPQDVMERVDRALGDGTETATCVYCIIDPDTETLTVSCAGHVPPLVVTPGGQATSVTVGKSVPLARLEVPHAQGDIPFKSGSKLLLYSDGLVERRHETIEDGLNRLHEVAGELAEHDVETFCDSLLEQLIGGRPQDDDVALVAVALKS